jgi:hypothetical protein
LTGQLLVAAVVTLCVVFGFSAVSKVVSVDRLRAFVESLRALRLLPVWLVGPVAVVVSCVELVIAVGLAAAFVGVVAGGAWAVTMAVLGLLLAVGLLGALTAGIVLALRHRSIAPCACFGASDRPLSWRHVLRNSVMQLVGVTGAVIAVAAAPVAVVDPVGAGLAGVVGAIVAVVLIRLDEIVELFAPTGLAGRAHVRS